MNSKQKYVIVLAVILIAVAAILWLTSGGEILSKDGIWVEKPMTELDKTLGQQPQLEFKEQFTLGLLPHTAVFVGSVVFISAILFYLFKSKKTKEIK
jgi:hypothetical protein